MNYSIYNKDLGKIVLTENDEYAILLNIYDDCVETTVGFFTKVKVTALTTADVSFSSIYKEHLPVDWYGHNVITSDGEAKLYGIKWVDNNCFITNLGSFEHIVYKDLSIVN